MSTVIVIIILIIICFFAIKNSRSHFKGEGGCCGGTVNVSNKTLNHIIDQKQVLIAGMHCENCANKITNAINQVSYLVCHVDFQQNMAYIDGSQMIDDHEIKNIIEKLGYQVTKIK